MIKYVFRRTLIFIPTLFIVSLLAFSLSKMAPGDPVDIFFPAVEEEGKFQSPREKELAYTEIAKALKLDLPNFYFSIHSLAFPDTLYKITRPIKRQSLEQLTLQSGNWSAVQDYQFKIGLMDRSIASIPDSLVTTNTKSLANTVNDLYYIIQPTKVRGKINAMQMLLDKNVKLIPFTAHAFAELKKAYQRLTDKAQKWKLFIPVVSWHGFNNQYHYWLSGFLVGNFGRSYEDGRLVYQKIIAPLKWTLFINIFAVIIAYGISIPLGVQTARKKGKPFDRLVTLLLFLLYSLPTFWIGTLLIIFFTNQSYGMDWFPTLGLYSVADDAPFWTRFWDTAHHLILPVFCLTYNAFAFITRQMRNSTALELDKLYILSARARGFSDAHVTWRHAFRNALFPIITLFASIFPALLAGSFVVEYIFNIPGMGLTTIQAIQNSDWPVVYAILMLSTVFTIIGMLIADILYALLNPRVSYT